MREGPGGCHSAEWTPRLPLTSVPRSPHPAGRGPRHCGSSLCGPALASSRDGPSARCPACSRRPRPLSFPRNRGGCRRSLSSSPPSLPFRLSAACAACGGGGRDAGAGGVAPPPCASGGVRVPPPGTFCGCAALCLPGPALPRPGPPRPSRAGAPFRVREDLWELRRRGCSGSTKRA